MSIPIERFESRTVTRDWGTETLLVETPHYVGKRLKYKAGKAGGLQLHKFRHETFHLHRGKAYVDYDAGDGVLTRTLMVHGDTFVIPPGAAHRLEAITDCIVYEWSNSAADDRVRLESHYGLPDPGGLPTTWPTEG